MLTAGLNLQSRCEAITSFSTPGLASLSASFLVQGSPIAVSEVCATAWPLPDPFVTSANLCHVTLSINTTESSTTVLEMFLPEKWNQRLLATGTGGFGGCVDFPSVNYGAEMGFAAVGTNAGHDGLSGAPLLHHPEMLTDFVWRSVHTEAVVGKELAHEFYGYPVGYSYYTGCSQGGRQGFRAAEQFPEDFDGIIAGDPALKFNNLISWSGVVPAPMLDGQPGAMSPADWALVHGETLKQCDTLDGKADGTIAYPEDCDFRPEVLLCSKFRQEPCLNAAQVDGLRTLYSPVYLTSGELLYPRYDPGSENNGPIFNITFGGQFSFLTLDGFRYVVYDNENWDPSTFSDADVEYAIKTNNGDIQTWTGDLRKFKRRGGKMLTYHGTADSIIPSGISPLQYKMTAGMTGPRAMDDWYALYLVPGMEHCWNLGSTLTGPWRFGQLGDVPEPRAAKNTSDYNALLALVDWVEKGQQPNLSGLTDAGETRKLCRYPQKGRWINGRWTCPSV
ncbi:Tannase/feruloyl esterase [Auriculariales sp. MPI-PUGE-AT-0066]|nr:Tannase/feruloyl esterase [Auriculariales sp. MPI-PUGE-AT-0066]